VTGPASDFQAAGHCLYKKPRWLLPPELGLRRASGNRSVAGRRITGGPGTSPDLSFVFPFFGLASPRRDKPSRGFLLPLPECMVWQLILASKLQIRKVNKIEIH
jgi:hypothetical protein